MAIIDLANPTRFLSLAHRALPWLIEITGAMFVIGLYLTYGAPDDYQQGATVKIMFITYRRVARHVRLALMSIAALGTLVCAIRSPTSRRRPVPGSAPRSPSFVSSPARCGAGRCGAPIGSGTPG
jgi:ABC-type transport system involved in cytochrome c biogenesis permease subunit